MFRKLIIILSALALQGCLIDVSSPSPRPRPSIACHYDRHCPVGFYCESDGYCYEEPRYVECFDDFDCPAHSWCGLNGLCYEESYHHTECYSHDDCLVNSYCAADGHCYAR